jgi:hypothetical protein
MEAQIRHQLSDELRPNFKTAFGEKMRAEVLGLLLSPQAASYALCRCRIGDRVHLSPTGVGQNL